MKRTKRRREWFFGRGKKRAEAMLVAEFRRTEPWLFENPPEVGFDADRPPVLIYQMGKVGSTSIAYTLEQIRLPNPVYHVHQLTYEGIDWNIRHYQELLTRNEADSSLDLRRRVYTDLYLKYNLRQYRNYLVLRRSIDRHLNDVTWKIITLVRDPIMREVSDFFFSFHRHPELAGLEGDRLRKKILSVLPDELEKCLLRPKNWVLTWFDEELKAVFGIDVYEYPFDLAAGYSLIHSSNIDLVVIKLEELTRCFTRAASDLLGLRDVTLIDQNLARQKNYYETYRFVLENLRLDAELCGTVYASRLVRHFYSAAEREGFTRKWTGSA